MLVLVGLFVALLIAGLATDELAYGEAFAYVIVFVFSVVLIRALDASFLWIGVPTIIFSSILVFRVIGYNPPARGGR